MADKTITDLNPLVTPASTDVLAIVDVAGNETKKIEVGNLVGSGGGVNNVMIPYGFFDSNLRDVYIPLISETETTTRQRFNRFIAPFDGSLKTCTFFTTGTIGGGTGFSLEIQRMTGASTYDVLETQSLSGLSGYVPSTMTFSSNSFSAGDVLYFWLTNGMTSAFSNLSGTLLFEVS